jgi:hypothetical protein
LPREAQWVRRARRKKKLVLSVPSLRERARERGIVGKVGMSVKTQKTIHYRGKACPAKRSGYGARGESCLAVFECRSVFGLTPTFRQ